MDLSLPAIRVLGALMEKARTTPESYPLTLNALVIACNQKTSRDPVTDYDGDEVLDALEELRENHLAMRVDMAGARTTKFRENASRVWELAREEYALLAVLMLRGPQTTGQLRQRCERLYPFAELPQVNDWLQRMQHRDEELHELVRPLGRGHGSKEIRFVHTLAPHKESIPEKEPAAPAGNRSGKTDLSERLDRLEKRLQDLETLINEITS
ncbi:MAG: YceH family protein [Opitutales bacterium]|jgi:uncharacterized protein YceH (UPF0502 family)